MTQLTEKGVGFISQKEEIDTFPFSSRLILISFAVLARFERENILEGMASRQNDRNRCNGADRDEESNILLESQGIVKKRK